MVDRKLELVGERLAEKRQQAIGRQVLERCGAAAASAKGEAEGLHAAAALMLSCASMSSIV